MKVPAGVYDIIYLIDFRLTAALKYDFLLFYFNSNVIIKNNNTN